MSRPSTGTLPEGCGERAGARAERLDQPVSSRSVPLWGAASEWNGLFRVSPQSAAAESRARDRTRRGETDGRVEGGSGGGWGRRREGRNTFSSPSGPSQHYSASRSDREFYLSPRSICAVGLEFSPRKVFWIIRAAILIRAAIAQSGPPMAAGVCQACRVHLPHT